MVLYRRIEGLIDFTSVRGWGVGPCAAECLIRIQRGGWGGRKTDGIGLTAIQMSLEPGLLNDRQQIKGLYCKYKPVWGATLSERCRFNTSHRGWSLFAPELNTNTPELLMLCWLFRLKTILMFSVSWRDMGDGVVQNVFFSKSLKTLPTLHFILQTWREEENSL